MAEIEFTIDPETGKLDVHVKGIRGPGCADIAKLVEEFFGPPQVDQNTPEYYLRPQVLPRIQPKSHP
jgi:hypothetical protein